MTSKPEMEGYEGVTDFWWADFDLAEIKMLRRKQRYTFRSHGVDSYYSVLTVEETIQNLLKNNQLSPLGKEFPVGLYIEWKSYDYYVDHYGYDTVDMLYDLLKKYGLETVEKSQNKLPIIVQSFKRRSL
jgi:glycerophosphoryl diester phosphodiesterase